MSVAPEPIPARRVAVIAALDFEKASLQALIGRAGPRASPAFPALSLFQAGIGPERSAQAARQAVESGAAGLVSWGVAGGLHPDMLPGTVVLPAEVYTSSGGRLATDRRWRDNLRQALSREFTVHEGGLLSTEAVLPTPRDKARAASQSGALAVDMESAAIGQVALSAGIPFVVLRVILDGVEDHLPDVAGLVDQTGNRDARAAFRIASRPTQWPGLIVLAWRFKRARAALGRCASRAALHAFHYPELSSAQG